MHVCVHMCCTDINRIGESSVRYVHAGELEKDGGVSNALCVASG